MYGANIRLWTFSKELNNDWVAQLNLCKQYKWSVVRDNSTEMGQEWSNGAYTLEIEREQVMKLIYYGLKVVLTISDCNPWLDTCVTTAQKNALMNRYKGNVLDVRRAINSIGIATAMPCVRSAILARSNALWQSRLGVHPEFMVEMDNGGEGVQWRGGPWDVLSDGFMREMRALGFPFPPTWLPLWWRQSIIRNNIASLRAELAQTWGSRLIGPAMHVYNWGYQPHQLGESSRIVTEFGASKNEGASRGVTLKSTFDALKDKTDLLLLHSPTDSRFMETFFSGETMKLWKAPDYQNLLASKGAGYTEYDGLLALEPSALSAISAL